MPDYFYSGFFACVFAAVFMSAWVVVERRFPPAPSRLRLRSPTERMAFRAALAVGLWSTYLFVSGGFRTQIFGLRIVVAGLAATGDPHSTLSGRVRVGPRLVADPAKTSVLC